jgi:O-antigen/teichoic acid export membrane protein
VSFDFKHLVSPGKLLALRKDTFYNNSMYLTLSKLISSAAGMLFWVVAARLYSQSEVGIATTLISTSTLVSNIALLGTGQSIIRFSPTHDRSMVLGTSLRITSYCSLLVGVLALALTAWWAPDLVMTPSYMVSFMMLSWTTTVFLTTTSAFTAWRRAGQTLLQQVVLASRVLLLFPLLALGALGITVSMTVSSVLAVVYSGYIIFSLGVRLPRMDRAYLRESLWFSAGNYVSALVQGLPALVAPLIVFGSLGANDAAVYYMASSIATMATIVPYACSNSLFVEGSHGEQFWHTAAKSLKASFMFLAPTIVGLFLLGGWLLSIFGAAYASGGTEVLRTLIFSVIFYTLFVTMLAWANVAKRMSALVALSLLNCATTLGLSYLLIGLYGLVGIGYAFIIGYAVSAAAGGVIIFFAERGRRTGDMPAPRSNERR